MIKQLLMVFIGGGLGSVLRLFIGWWINNEQFKWIPTLSVNLVGCFLLGIFAASTHRNLLDSNIYILLGVGFCGGLTTFSTFSLDSLQLFKTQDYLQGISYITLSILLGLLMIFLGYSLIKNDI